MKQNDFPKIEELRAQSLGKTPPKKPAEGWSDDVEKLTKLIAEGVRIEVKNPRGKTFRQRYRFFQGQSDKIALVDDDGEIRGFEA